jgi:23S rRNA (adenine2503-C2)-methyltransferase
MTKHSIHDLVAIDNLAARVRVPRDDLHRLRAAFYRRHRDTASALAELPVERRTDFAAAVDFHPLHLEQRLDSRVDGATKLLFRTRLGLPVESVLLRIASGRTSLCISSQVGCAVGCGFCATGAMPVVRNLTLGELLDQVVQAGRLAWSEGRRLRNVVFMGMGEPLHNAEAVHAALEVLTSPRGFAFFPRRVLISTIGLPERMTQLARAFPRVRLAVSLHAARQEVRERLIPLARRVPLTDLRAALAEVAATQQQPVMIEYVLLRGVNDAAGDRAALIDFLTGLPVHVNLIPYNPIDSGGAWQGVDAEERRVFAAALRAAGFPVTVRYSLGSDIAAACGQLARRDSLELVTVEMR